MDEKIMALMMRLENTYKNRSGKVQECFSVGHWFMRVNAIGLHDAFNEFEKSCMGYIEGRNEN